MPLITHFADLQTIRAPVLFSLSLPLMQQSLNYFNVPRSFPKSFKQEISPPRSKSHDDLFIYSRREYLWKTLVMRGFTIKILEKVIKRSSTRLVILILCKCATDPIPR